MSEGRLGGLLVRADGDLRFVPASVALHVAVEPRVTRLPGAPHELVGVALYEGTIVPVLSIGSSQGQMIVCQHGGEMVGLVGAEILQAGMFSIASADPAEIEHEGARARVIDVGALYAQVEAAARPHRWG